MRARIAIFKAQQPVLLRDLVLTKKPKELLEASPKGTVPVLVLNEGVEQHQVSVHESGHESAHEPGHEPAHEPAHELAQTSVIEESLEVMMWALGQSDPDNLLQKKVPGEVPGKGDYAVEDKEAEAKDDQSTLAEMQTFITQYDNEFKPCLERYRCAKRYHEDNLIECRQACEVYIQALEQRLNHNPFFMSVTESLVDIALLPFIRQFAQVERQWYLQSPYPKLRIWLNNYLQSRMFSKVMAKHPLWLETGENVIFGGN